MTNTPSSSPYPPDHVFAKFVATDTPENIYYADLFEIAGRNWMILGSGKSTAARIASENRLEAMYATDSVAILRNGNELWARYDQGVLPSSTHPNPELFKIHRLNAIAYCLDEQQTETAYRLRSERTIVKVNAATLMAFCATYPYPAAMAQHFFDDVTLERLSDPGRMTRRFGQLTHGSSGTDFLLVPYMPSVEEKAALYRNYTF